MCLKKEIKTNWRKKRKETQKQRQQQQQQKLHAQQSVRVCCVERPTLYMSVTVYTIISTMKRIDFERLQSACNVYGQQSILLVSFRENKNSCLLHANVRRSDNTFTCRRGRGQPSAARADQKTNTNNKLTFNMIKRNACFVVGVCVCMCVCVRITHTHLRLYRNNNLLACQILSAYIAYVQRTYQSRLERGNFIFRMNMHVYTRFMHSN